MLKAFFSKRNIGKIILGSFLTLLFSLHANGQTLPGPIPPKGGSYDDGRAAGIRDAEALKATVSARSPLAGISVSFTRRAIEPTGQGGTGAQVSEYDNCPSFWGCVDVVTFNNSEATANVAMWNDHEVIARREYLHSRSQENNYWRGIYDGFLMRWFFSDYSYSNLGKKLQGIMMI